MTCCCKIFISNIKMAFGYECLEIPNTVKKKKRQKGYSFLTIKSHPFVQSVVTKL